MYSNSILPTTSYGYTFKDAEMLNGGILHIKQGGSVSYSANAEVLPSLPGHFRISILTDSKIDRYKPTLFVHIDAIASSGKMFNYTLVPAVDQGAIYTQEIPMEKAGYTKCEFSIYSDKEVYIQLYELCPEASDGDAQVEIENVKQSLPRLLYDYNTLPLVVEQLETVVGMITFNLKSATDLQGHLTIAYVASQSCVLTLRVKDLDVTELYTPIQYDIKAGRGNITLPHAYLQRLGGYHTTYITVQVSAGTLTINTRGLLYTIDGGYLAERLADPGVEVYDMSVRQISADDSKELWVIGVDAGQCYVRTRPFDADPMTSFEAKYQIGEAITAALEFNGLFQLTPGSSNHTLITEEEPFVFFVAPDGTLYAQYGAEEATRFTMDTGVTMVSACRGYNSVYAPENDQGLIVLYVKDGKATYRTYAQKADGSFTWQGPFVIDEFDEPVISAYVHRLNDYRVAFTISTLLHNYWYISNRTYVTQASPVETIAINYGTTYSAVAMLTPPGNYSLIAEALKEPIFGVRFNYPITAVGPLEPSFFHVTPDVGISKVEIVDNYTLAFTIATLPVGSFTISYNYIDPRLKFSPQKTSWVAMPSFSCTYNIKHSHKDTIGIKYGNVTGSVVAHQIRTKRVNAQPHDTISIKYGKVTGSVVAHQILTKRSPVQPGDTISIKYGNVTGTIALTQTGVSPI